MASQPTHDQTGQSLAGQAPPARVVEAISGPQHFTPPSARELRAQAVQRLQAGLFGLAAILLIVGLANIINDRARLADQTEGKAGQGASALATDEAKTDPLAEIGVVPATTPEAKPAPAASPAPGANR